MYWNLNKLVYLLFLSLAPITLGAQKSIDKALERYNRNSAPYISTAQASTQTQALYLDARELEEYKVSHLAHAEYIGYKNFNLDAFKQKYSNKTTPIIVYCSIGVRSENIATKLLKAGYTDVQNLYGGIFKWLNEDRPIYDQYGNLTEKIHPYSKHWGKLLTNGTKVYH
ncbi:rhodanese-like domain-containing protein [Croceivirga sp. JEA036]|uniref:rhodanese-like domain-containing protein n=1 Tax=Croceivirga sp. JEA036 TaxID=2721162 RepID=UPI00143C1400|nr:rhodanese-like domain-containing protein [Croceivirga sp. JEA036]NJB36691.1 rhodanese-like domain-containing protein [Croceivirga sp. JEA036]